MRQRFSADQRLPPYGPSKLQRHNPGVGSLSTNRTTIIASQLILDKRERCLINQSQGWHHQIEKRGRFENNKTETDFWDSDRVADGGSGEGPFSPKGPPNLSENLKTLSLSLKSSEEIELFSLPEDLGEIERATLLLGSSQVIQRASVAANLRNLLACNRQKTVELIVPRLLGLTASIFAMPQPQTSGHNLGNINSLNQSPSRVSVNSKFHYEMEFYMASARGFASALEAKLFHCQELTEVILPKILSILSVTASAVPSSSYAHPPSVKSTGMFDFGATEAHTNPTLSVTVRSAMDLNSAWSSVLTMALDQLDRRSLVSTVVPFAVSRGNYKETICSRLNGARLLGALCPLLDQSVVETTLFAVGRSLCQDVSADVRSLMAKQIPPLARAVRDHETIRNALINELVELLGDEQPMVKQAAFESFSAAVDITPTEVKITVLLPIFKKLCKESTEDDIILPIIRHFGPFFYHSYEHLSDDDVTDFMMHYKQLARNNTSRKSSEI
ncbi:serine/threonine-protein phosphatase 4 regulatory subunit 4-like isoform 2, partial [Planoprotostelium fungivorum]